MNLSPAVYPATANLRQLIVLRSVVVLIQILATAVAIYGLGVHLAAGPLMAVIAVYTVLTALTQLRLRHPKPVTETELFVQLLSDVLVLAALLYFSGGSTNPFVSLFLLPLAIAATALPGRSTWFMALMTAICYSLLMVFYVPMHGDAVHAFNMHVWGMWFNFMLSAALISYFVVKMGNTLRARDQALAQAREQTLRDERLVALGTLAAGAAHELGTPLSTMAVLTRDVEQECAAMPELAARLGVLREQVTRCKGILTTMAASAGQVRAESGRGRALDDYLEDTVRRWSEARPGVRAHYHGMGTLPAPFIVAEHILTQAIMNILNNAADASPQNVEINADWDKGELRLEVCDHGAGLTPLTQARAGELLFTTKSPEQGLGLGLFLAHATLQRLGGEVRLFNREGGGACTRVVLPLTALTADNSGV